MTVGFIRANVERARGEVVLWTRGVRRVPAGSSRWRRQKPRALSTRGAKTHLLEVGPNKDRAMSGPFTHGNRDLAFDGRSASAGAPPAAE